MTDEVMKNLPAPYQLRRYYLSSEIKEHNTADSCWVSLFQRVFDLTKLIQENYASDLVDPIVLNAGTDITHWFNNETREPKIVTDPETGI